MIKKVNYILIPHPIYIIYIFLVSVMLHTVARFTPVEWVLLDACDLAGNPTEVVRLMLMIMMIMVIFVIMMIATR